MLIETKHHLTQLKKYLGWDLPEGFYNPYHLDYLY